jgi:hypothetical protein
MKLLKAFPLNLVNEVSFRLLASGNAPAWSSAEFKGFLKTVHRKKFVS